MSATIEEDSMLLLVIIINVRKLQTQRLNGKSIKSTWLETKTTIETSSMSRKEPTKTGSMIENWL